MKNEEENFKKWMDSIFGAGAAKHAHNLPEAPLQQQGGFIDLDAVTSAPWGRRSKPIDILEVWDEAEELIKD